LIIDAPPVLAERRPIDLPEVPRRWQRECARAGRPLLVLQI